MLDKRGQTVTIRKRTEGAKDEFNVPTFTWSDEATEQAVITSPAIRTFAEVMWTYQGQMEKHDRLGYFASDSVVDENKRVVLQSSERYEVDVVDSPVMFGAEVLKMVLLRRIVEQ